MRSLLLPLALLTLTCTSASALAVGDTAPKLGATSSFNTPNGGAVELNMFKGRVVLIDFWATWCGPCVAAIPHVQKLHETYGNKGLVVIGHTDASSQGLEGFIKQKGITYPITVGPDIGKAWGVTGIPHVFVVDVNGKIAWHGHPGALQDSIIEQELKKVSTSIAAGSSPSFDTASKDPEVAQVEQAISAGHVGKGLDALQKLEKKGKAAATASIATVEKWISTQQAEIDSLREAGDTYAAYQISGMLSKQLTGDDRAKTYSKLARELKKDDGYKAGQECEKIAAIPEDARSDPRFTAMVDKFLKKYPEGFYADKVRALK
ncbi:MAG: redoxin family protein [Planctomycetota bacterium]|jgi:thiol-disulfide isomerase/thioredoxin|nr:redoxin family protein [Planctomycetota bacterium]